MIYCTRNEHTFLGNLKMSGAPAQRTASSSASRSVPCSCHLCFERKLNGEAWPSFFMIQYEKIQWSASSLGNQGNQHTVKIQSNSWQCGKSKCTSRLPASEHFQQLEQITSNSNPKDLAALWPSGGSQTLWVARPTWCSAKAAIWKRFLRPSRKKSSWRTTHRINLHLFSISLKAPTNTWLYSIWRFPKIGVPLNHPF